MGESELVTVPAEQLFDRVQPEALAAEDWTVVDERSGLRLACRPLSASKSLLRVEYEWPLPISEAVGLMRPEVYWDPRRPEYDEGTQECAIEACIAPGDALVSMTVKTSTSAPFLSASQHAVLGAATMSDRSKQTNYMRWIVRRDFPSPGKFTCLTLPMDAETGDFYEERGMISSCTVVFEPHATEKDRTSLTRVSTIQRSSTALMSHIAGHFLKKHAWISRYHKSAVYADAKDLGGLSYVVIGIKKCSRGPPLLPSSLLDNGIVLPTIFDSEWTSACFETNQFPSYLGEFLRQIGIQVAIYNSLDGRRLVPYQAVMLRCHWDMANAALAEPWKAHKAAYRKRYGGTCAPYIIDNMEPRFLTGEPAIPIPVEVSVQGDSAAPNGYPEKTAKDAPIAVKNSFLHFAPPPGLALVQRSNSNPNLVDMAE